MLQNHITIAIRNLLKYKSYTLINIVGLAIGLASSIMIAIFAYHEWSYDKFHINYNRIHQVYPEGKLFNDPIHLAATSMVMSKPLVSEVEEVEKAVRVGRFGQWHVSSQNQSFNEDRVIFTDSTFFDVFSFKLLVGNPKTALLNPRSLIISETTAKRYFGDVQPIGKTLKIENDSVLFTITGIVADCPQNSHFHFDLIGSMKFVEAQVKVDWLSNNIYTFVLLKKKATIANLNKNLDKLSNKYIIPLALKYFNLDISKKENRSNYYYFRTIPLANIYLHSDLQYPLEPVSSIFYVYLFAIVALTVLLIACFNFMNLTTALSANRTKEIALRKIVGSSRSKLITQFLVESIVLSVVATLLSLIFVELLLPLFAKLTDIKLSINYFSDWKIVPALISLTLVTGIISGSYPSFILSMIRPIDVLKGKLRLGVRSLVLRSVLVVLQFSVSIFILFAAFTVYQQINYFKTKKIGFDKENILIIRRSDVISGKFNEFSEQLKKISEIADVTHSNSIPGRNQVLTSYKCDEITKNRTFLFHQIYVDYDFQKVYKLELKSGRYFSKNTPSDTLGVVINEAAEKALGFEKPIGKIIYRPSPDQRQKLNCEILGVMKDFNFQSLHKSVTPIVLLIIRYKMEGYVSIKTKSKPDSRTISSIKKVWDANTNNFPFEYLYLNEDLNRHYTAEIRTSIVMNIFSVLAILVASLGLFGLIAFTSLQRTREIGIRKVFGASAFNVIFLLSKETIKLVIWAAIISFPFAYWIVNYWLSNFAYRIAISIPTFIFTALIILVVALATVFFQAFKAALINPSNALKHE